MSALHTLCTVLDCCISLLVMNICLLSAVQGIRVCVCCMYVCVKVKVCVCVFVCVFVYIYIYIYICVYAYMVPPVMQIPTTGRHIGVCGGGGGAHIYIYTYIYTYIYVCMYVRTYVGR